MPRISTAPAIATAEALGIDWLVRLRWLAVAGQVAMWWLSREWLSLDVETVPALSVALVMAASNVALMALKRGIAVVLVVDVLFLTAFLHYTGSETSPFSAFYIVNVAIAARLSSPRVTALVWAISTLAFGTLFVGGGHHGTHAAHYRGMWVAYAFTALVTAYFVSRVTATLADRNRRLEAMQRLAATSTLAASAAHELGTPHGTIAVLAEGLTLADIPARFREDAATILAQVQRCRDIVNELNAGEITADSLSRISVRDVLMSHGVDVDAPADVSALLPTRAFNRVVANLVKNARDAQARHITLQLRTKEHGFELRVIDDGGGISPMILDKLGTPYVTTKPTGSGLGLYLCAVFAESLRGTLSIETGAGTTVTLWIPA